MRKPVSCALPLRCWRLRSSRSPEWRSIRPDLRTPQTIGTTESKTSPPKLSRQVDQNVRTPPPAWPVGLRRPYPRRPSVSGQERLRVRSPPNPKSVLRRAAGHHPAVSCSSSRAKVAKTVEQLRPPAARQDQSGNRQAALQPQDQRRQVWTVQLRQSQSAASPCAWRTGRVHAVDLHCPARARPDRRRYSQLELRVLAAVSGDAVMNAAFSNGQDLQPSRRAGCCISALRILTKTTQHTRRRAPRRRR